MNHLFSKALDSIKRRKGVRIPPITIFRDVHIKPITSYDKIFEHYYLEALNILSKTKFTTNLDFELIPCMVAIFSYASAEKPSDFMCSALSNRLIAWIKRSFSFSSYVYDIFTERLYFYKLRSRYELRAEWLNFDLGDYKYDCVMRCCVVLGDYLFNPQCAVNYNYYSAPTNGTTTTTDASLFKDSMLAFMLLMQEFEDEIYIESGSGHRYYHDVNKSLDTEPSTIEVAQVGTHLSSIIPSSIISSADQSAHVAAESVSSEPTPKKISQKLKNPPKELSEHEKLHHFFSVYESIIDEIESNLHDFKPSCKPVLLASAKPLLEQSSDYVSRWDSDFDYENLAYKIIYNISFDLLSSGQYHIYRGELNPLNESSHLYYMVEQCLEYCLKNNIMNESAKQEQLDILRENISMVG